MRPVSVRHLAPPDIDEAYVLVRLGYDNLSQEDWRAMARNRVAAGDGDSGILIARDRFNRLRGLLLYAITPKFAGRPCLQVDRLISVDLMNPEVIADALITEVLRVAEIRDCDSLSLVRPLDAPQDTAALVLASGATVLHQVF